MPRSRKSKTVKPLNIPQPKQFHYLQPKSNNQKEYIRTIAENDVTFAVGPAGSGKTCVAIGMAIQYFLEGRCSKIVVTRPVLESGERLGALPGDLKEKIAPYLVPIFDEVKKYLSYSDMNLYLNKTDGGIEIAPLAYMRGRTFNNTFIVLDEAQNCTREQLKMFVTRIGIDSKMVITGDLEQSDLPRHLGGALSEFVEKLSDINGVGISKLEYNDIVRHTIIGDILSRLSKEN